MDLDHWQLKSKGSYNKLHMLLACTAWYDALRLVFYVQNYRYGFHISVLCLQRSLSAYTVRHIIKILQPTTYGKPVNHADTNYQVLTKAHSVSIVWGNSWVTILIGLPMLCRNLLIIPHVNSKSWHFLSIHFCHNNFIDVHTHQDPHLEHRPSCPCSWRTSQRCDQRMEKWESLQLQHTQRPNKLIIN